MAHIRRSSQRFEFENVPRWLVNSLKRCVTSVQYDDQWPSHWPGDQWSKIRKIRLFVLKVRPVGTDTYRRGQKAPQKSIYSNLSGQEYAHSIDYNTLAITKQRSKNKKAAKIEKKEESICSSIVERTKKKLVNKIWNELSLFLTFVYLFSFHQICVRPFRLHSLPALNLIHFAVNVFGFQRN